MIIRDATIADMAAVRDLYNALITTTTVAWSETEETLAERLQWFARQQEASNPVLVADDGDGVVGFATYESFRGEGKWPGYRFTVEHSIHVAEGHWSRGVGRQLMEALIERALTQGMHVMVGALDAHNTASVRFHERLGFVEVARMPEVGHKFGRWLDLVLMQRILGTSGG